MVVVYILLCLLLIATAVLGTGSVILLALLAIVGGVTAALMFGGSKLERVACLTIGAVSLIGAWRVFGVGNEFTTEIGVAHFIVTVALIGAVIADVVRQVMAKYRADKVAKNGNPQALVPADRLHDQPRPPDT